MCCNPILHDVADFFDGDRGSRWRGSNFAVAQASQITLDIVDYAGYTPCPCVDGACDVCKQAKGAIVGIAKAVSIVAIKVRDILSTRDCFLLLLLVSLSFCCSLYYSLPMVDSSKPFLSSRMRNWPTTVPTP
jgi:hypothetical protein